MQIGILRGCPPLCGVVIKFSMGAANSPALWIKTLFRIAVRTPGALLIHFRNKWQSRVTLSHVGIIATTRCTLKCDKCLGHIPDMKSHVDIPASDLVSDLQSLFACVDYIYNIVLSGGEAFLHPGLDEIIRACAESGKISDISVQSNGTVIPDMKVLTALREAGATVKISRYPETLQPDVEKLKQLLRESGIRYTHQSGTFWNDMGGFGQWQEGAARRRFSVCPQQLCHSFVKGKFFLCCKSAVLLEEGVVPDCEEDYIDVRATGSAAFEGQLRKLFKTRTLVACSYCLGNTYNSSRVPVAVQRVSHDV